MISQSYLLIRIVGKVNLTLLVDKLRCSAILLNQEQEVMLKAVEFCHLEETYPTNTEETYCMLLLKQDQML